MEKESAKPSSVPTTAISLAVIVLTVLLAIGLWLVIMEPTSDEQNTISPTTPDIVAVTPQPL